MVPKWCWSRHGGVGPGFTVIPPNYFWGAPPPPPPPRPAPSEGVPEPAGPPPPCVVHAREDPSNPNNRLKTACKNRMCALITAIDMNLTDRVIALCDVFLEKKKIQGFVCAEVLCCQYKYEQHYASNIFYRQLQLKHFWWGEKRTTYSHLYTLNWCHSKKLRFRGDNQLKHAIADHRDIMLLQLALLPQCDGREL